MSAIINFDLNNHPKVINMLILDGCSSPACDTVPKTSDTLSGTDILMTPASKRETDPNNALFGIMVDPSFNGLSVYKFVDLNTDDNTDSHDYKISAGLYCQTIWQVDSTKYPDFQIGSVQIGCDNQVAYLYAVDATNPNNKVNIIDDYVDFVTMGYETDNQSSGNYYYLCAWQVDQYGTCTVIQRYPIEST